jgi:hypothetical protein
VGTTAPNDLGSAQCPICSRQPAEDLGRDLPKSLSFSSLLWLYCTGVWRQGGSMGGKNMIQPGKQA